MGKFARKIRERKRRVIEFNKEWIRERKRCALDNRDYGREQRAMKQMKNNDYGREQRAMKPNFVLEPAPAAVKPAVCHASAQTDSHWYCGLDRVWHCR